MCFGRWWGLLVVVVTLAGCSGADGADYRTGEPDAGAGGTDASSDHEIVVVGPEGGPAQDGTTADADHPDGPGSGDGEGGVIAEGGAIDEAGMVSEGGAIGEAGSDDAPQGCPTGDIQCSGACVPSDAHNCGTCGHDCTNLPHVAGTTSCTGAGTCTIPAASCAGGWADCNGNPDDGCETDETTPAHCGSCVAVCPSTDPVCSASGSSYACATGCASTTPTLCGGVCVDTTTNANDCSACGHTCASTVSNSQPTCVASNCAFTCNGGFTGCPGAAPTACVDEQHDPSNCGACGKACPGPTSGAGQPACTGGGCTVNCNAGYSGCPAAGLPTTCVDQQTDDANCGGCGAACGGGEHCVGGKCQCASGQHLCGSPAACVNDDINACGPSCEPCTGPVDATVSCDGTSCHWACNAGFSGCPAASPVACDNFASDNANCGACGHACAGGETCQGGTCACPTEEALCGATCVNETSDPNNCGACGHGCTGGETCQGGTCACPTGETLCGATCASETTDASNCGTCGHGCLGGTCSGGMCQPVVLTTPGGNVEDVATDGTYVYWTAIPSGVGKCAIADCAATVTSLATGLGDIFPIAQDPFEGRVYFGESTVSNAGGLWYTDTFPAAAKPWGPDRGNYGEVDAIWVGPSGVVYWAGDNEGVYMSNGAGSLVVNMITGNCTMGVTADASRVYAADNCGGRLLSCQTAGNPSGCGASPTVIATGIPGANKLYYDGSAVWLTAKGTSANNYSDGALYKCSSASCSLFASNQAYAAGVASDGTNVYWTDTFAGSVMRSPTGAPAPVQIASVFTPLGLTQTSTAVLWADQDQGSVYLLAK